jgi:hypothetical protein
MLDEFRLVESHFSWLIRLSDDASRRCIEPYQDLDAKSSQPGSNSDSQERGEVVDTVPGDVTWSLNS